MAHLQALSEEDSAGLDEVLDRVRDAMGFVPNSLRTMSRRPELVKAFVGFAGTVQGGAQIDPVLQQLVAHVASTAAGCSYCQAHTGAVAERRGASADLVAQAWDFETSDAFDDRQRAALRLARDAAVVPNAVTADHFEDLRRHFDEAQIVDLVAVISLFGFLNRWNDTFATHLEAEPKSFGERNLGARGWKAGKHE